MIDLAIHGITEHDIVELERAYKHDHNVMALVKVVQDQLEDEREKERLAKKLV